MKHIFKTQRAIVLIHTGEGEFLILPSWYKLHFSFNYNKIHRQLGIDLTFTLFQALLQPELSETEVKISEKTEKLVHIIMPDLLNYLEMVESGEIIEKRIEKNKLLKLKYKKEIHKEVLNNKTPEKKFTD